MVETRPGWEGPFTVQFESKRPDVYRPIVATYQFRADKVRRVVELEILKIETRGGLGNWSQAIEEAQAMAWGDLRVRKLVEPQYKLAGG